MSKILKRIVILTLFPNIPIGFLLILNLLSLVFQRFSYLYKDHRNAQKLSIDHRTAHQDHRIAHFVANAANCSKVKLKINFDAICHIFRTKMGKKVLRYILQGMIPKIGPSRVRAPAH